MGKSLRVGIAGLGTVGAGVLDLLATHADLLASRAGIPIEIAAVSARDRSKRRNRDLSRFNWFDDPRELAAFGGIDVFVELIGGEGDPAKTAVEGAQLHLVLLPGGSQPLAVRAQGQPEHVGHLEPEKLTSTGCRSKSSR